MHTHNPSERSRTFQYVFFVKSDIQNSLNTINQMNKKFKPISLATSFKSKAITINDNVKHGFLKLDYTTNVLYHYNVTWQGGRRR